MKKFLILMLVLAMASSANAATTTISVVSGGSATATALKNSTVTVDVVSPDTAVTSGFSCNFGETTTSANHSTATIGTLHDDLTVSASVGVVQNAMTNWPSPPTRYVLIDRIGASPTQGVTVAAGEKLYTFSLAIPSGALVGDTFTVSAINGTPAIAPPYGPYSVLLDGVAPTAWNSLVITVVPEPMTIALLGLGGLFLRRRK